MRLSLILWCWLKSIQRRRQWREWRSLTFWSRRSCRIRQTIISNRRRRAYRRRWTSSFCRITMIKFGQMGSVSRNMSVRLRMWSLNQGSIGARSKLLWKTGLIWSKRRRLFTIWGRDKGLSSKKLRKMGRRNQWSSSLATVQKHLLRVGPKRLKQTSLLKIQKWQTLLPGAKQCTLQLKTQSSKPPWAPQHHRVSSAAFANQTTTAKPARSPLRKVWIRN